MFIGGTAAMERNQWKHKFSDAAQGREMAKTGIPAMLEQ